MIRPFESTEGAEHTDAADGGGKKSLASGVFADLTDIADTDPEGRELLIGRAVVQMGLAAPMIATDLAPMHMMGIRFMDTGDLWTDNHGGKNSAVSAMMVLSCEDIVDITNFIPPGFKFGMKGGPKSVLKINGAIPAHIWFRAANLQIALNYQNSNARIIPFPIIVPGSDKEGDAEFQDTTIVYQAICVSPTEYEEYIRILKQYVTADGLEKGFASAARLGYVAIMNRIKIDIEERNEIIRIKNKRKMEHEPMIPSLAPFEPTHEITEEDVDKWTTSLIIKRDSSLRGALFDGWLKEDFAEVEKIHIYV